MSGNSTASSATLDAKDSKKAVKRVDSVDIGPLISNLKGVIIQQEIEPLELATRFETQNKYAIKTLKGQDLFIAFEDSAFVLRNCCGAKRNFKMKIFNFEKSEVMRLERPWRCQSCWFFCCLQKLEVYSPVKNFIGSIHQDWNMFRPSLSVYDDQGDKVYIIKGPVFSCKMCGNVEFKILSADDNVLVGRFTRLWKGPMTEFLLSKIIDVDTYELLFPDDSNVTEKALLIGAAILLDYMFFEGNTLKKKMKKKRK